MIDPTATHPLLRELNDALAIEGAEPVDWIVCGGTALGILGLVQRPTSTSACRPDARKGSRPAPSAHTSRCGFQTVAT